MKQLFGLLLTLLLVRPLSAQNKIYEELIGWRGKNIELHTLQGCNKQQNCVFLMNGDSIRLFFLDNTGTVIRQFGVRRKLGEKLLGGFIKEGKICIFLHVDHGEPHMHGWTFDIAAGTAEDYYIPFAMEHEKMAERISGGDRFLCFAVNKKAAQFVLYDFRDGQHYDSLHYQFEGGIWKTLTKSAGLSRDINVAEFDQEGESSVENAQTPNKLYLIRDTLYLLMNADKGVTGIFHFDLQHRQVAYREILHHKIGGQETSPADYTDNAYLLYGKLYFVSFIRDSLNVEARDFGNGELLHQYMAGKEEEIPFKNPPIIQEGSSFSKNSSRELPKTRQLIRKMLNETAVIMASREDSGRVSLYVGSIEKTSSGGVGGGGGAGVWKGAGGGGPQM